MPNKQENFMPNIIVWAWMRTVLGLAGTEILIFSYIYSLSFDSVHKCYTPLCDMEKWFGITRQTISRNIDRLESKNYIIKDTMTDKYNKMIKHNSYCVNMPVVTDLCEQSDYDSYKNFLDSYSFVLKNTFPNQVCVIDEYLDAMLTWHRSKSVSIRVTLNDLAQILETHGDNCNLSDLLSEITNNPKLNVAEPKSKKEPQKKKVDKLFGEEKKRSTRAKKNEWLITKQEMSKEFVFMKANANLDLLNALCDFLGTKNGMGYTPVQWQSQLDNLYKYGRTVERMIEGVRTSFMNNYRCLYIVDKSEVDIDKKLSEIDSYVKENADNSEELKKWLCLYVTEVPKGKSSTITQFKLMLDNLSDICKTVESKIKSVKLSYTNSYSALAYRSASSQADQEVDMEEKKVIVHKFIVDGYYQLCDNLESSLLNYVQNTKYGKSMKAEDFKIVLNNLRLYCLDDIEKVDKVMSAIQSNKSVLATEDFDETRKLKARYETRETMATSMDRSRKLRVEQAKLKNPNDPRLKDIVVERRKQNIV